VESCCTSYLIPQGPQFYRTYSYTDAGLTGEANLATVSPFRLDKYLVTVGRFRKFVTAWNAGYTPPAQSGKHTHLNGGNGLNATSGGYEPGWSTSDNTNVAPTDANLTCFNGYSTWTSTPGSQEDLPINCVNFWEAYAFCTWDSGFLPSEAEWEYAAAGGSDQREYPWGSADPGTQAQYAIYGGYVGSQIANVGSATLGVARWGQMDLVGELWEWTIDWYSTYTIPCADCADLTASTYKSVRGGEFYSSPAIDLVPSTRNNDYPAHRSEYNGFRCGRSP
jgi:formylglycine-generating enzyme required for sulfatase activity